MLVGVLVGPVAGQIDVPSPPKAALLDLRLVASDGGHLGEDRMLATVLLYPETEEVELALEAEFVVFNAADLRARFKANEARRKGLPPGEPETPDALKTGRLPNAPVATAPTQEPISTKPLMAIGDAPRDANGRYRQKMVARGRPKEGAVVEVPIIVQRDTLKWPTSGNYFYVLRGSVAGDVVFESATRAMTHVEGGLLGGEPPEPKDNQATFKVLPKRPILFATNRVEKFGLGAPSARFGDDVGPSISHGTCLVNIPVRQHIQGMLELPGWFSRGDQNNFFQIDATTKLEPGPFCDIVRGTDTRGDILIFVHGFNTSFDFAVLRLAQVVHDVQFAGMPVVFSWPSHGSATAYGADEVNALRSVDALAETLLVLIRAQSARQKSRRGKIHVLAHSLGNRVTLRALERLDAQLAPGDKPFGQVILAAPDVSVEDFARQVPRAQARAERVSLYFCPDDQALLASQVRHPNEPRAGRGVVQIAGIDNIDARKANTSFLGHGYWSEVKQLLIDMQMLINLGWTPAQRSFTLAPESQPPNYQFWSFR